MIPDNNVGTSEAAQTQNSFTLRNRKTEWNSNGKTFFLEKYDYLWKKYQSRLNKPLMDSFNFEILVPKSSYHMCLTGL